MKHDEALEMMATEKYLLDELPADIKEQFEEHFFGCPECAADVRMTAAFIEQTKKTRTTPTPVLSTPTPRPKPVSSPWRWQAVSAFSFIVLLLVVGYQALVVRPRTNKTIADLQQPQVLASIYLSHGTARSDNRPTVVVPVGQPFVLFVDIPADSRFQSYSAELLNPSGSKLWSLTILSEKVESAKDALPIRMPPLHDASGGYELVVRGVSREDPTGTVVGRYLFELKTQ